MKKSWSTRAFAALCCVLVVALLALPVASLASSADDEDLVTVSDEADDEDETDEDETIDMLRLYNPYSGEHLYTSDTNERDVLVGLGWEDEGVAWIAPMTSETPVYRLYNPYTGEHHYTTDKNEYDTLAELGWEQEGIGFYSDDDEGVVVWRLYNPYEEAFYHLFTTDENEYDTLAELGWEREGVAWYGVSEGTPIMGETVVTAEQLAAYYCEVAGEDTYPSDVYADYGAATIEEFCEILVEEAEAEGVRAEVVFAQCMKETNWLRFTGQVKVWQCNFAGLGALNSTVDDEDEDETIVDEDETASDTDEATDEEDSGEDAEVAEESDASTDDESADTSEEADASADDAVTGEDAATSDDESDDEDGASDEGSDSEGDEDTAYGAVFEDVRTGLRAQVQHLKAYASTEDLVNECVDPRFDLVTRGIAPTLEELNGRWAVPGDGYGESIAAIIDDLLEFVLC